MPWEKSGRGAGLRVEFDSRLCIGCRACVVACAEARGLPPNEFLHRIEFLESGRFPEVRGRFVRKTSGCDLCYGRSEGPVCLKACPTGALKGSKPSAHRFAVRGHRVVHTVCLACNARCGLRVWVKDGRPVAFEGNPYHPYNRRGSPLPYSVSVKEALKEEAFTCGKPHCDVDYLENPYRILVPLKRAGPRGSGKFVPIEWETLIKEVAEGGKLFSHLGDENHYPGLKDVLSDELIDPSAPELGPKRNQLVWLTGRSQGGRKEFIDRFVKQAVGSVNHIGHTDICGLGFRMGNFALTDGVAVELKADIKRTKYAVVFGANAFSAGQPGPCTLGAILARRVAEGKCKVVLVDPRGHEALSVAHEWLAVRPGEDGAVALGMLRVILEEGLYDEKFLSLCSRDAAKEKGYGVFTNATHLVVVEKGHRLWGRFLRTKDVLGVEGEAEEPLVVEAETEKLVPSNEAFRARLFWEGRLKLSDGSTVSVKTAFLLFKESVFERELSYYAERAGVPEEKIRKVAREFAEAAPEAAAFAYHGGGNYPDGAYASFAVALLNAVVGSVNKRGGYLPSGGGAAEWRKGFYDLSDFPGSYKPTGVAISREKAAYEDTSEFRRKGYPAKLPWFPFTNGGLCVSALEGVEKAYPYPIKVLITYFFNPTYSIPGGRRFEEVLADQTKVPLHISIDVTVNETNIYADYIVPDVTYLEGHYGFLTPHAPGERFTAVRTPVVEPRTERTPKGRPMCLETFLVDLAEYLGLPGFGEKAIPGADGRLYPLMRAEDFYLRGLSNLAENAGVPEAPEEERRFVEENYPVARYKEVLDEKKWSRVCTVLARGGVFSNEEELFDEYGNFKSKLKGQILCVWNERMANAGSGLSQEKFYGTVRYRERRFEKDYPFFLITHKLPLHTQSRTVCYRRALALLPEPFLLLNPRDAEELGVSEGEVVRVTSKALPEGIAVRVALSERVRPGCVVLPHHYGHWQHGAGKLVVSEAERVFLGGKNVARGEEVLPAPERARGASPNLLFSVRIDPLGGIPDFSLERVRIERIRKR